MATRATRRPIRQRTGRLAVVGGGPALRRSIPSWLDQAELLINAFGRRYLKRASWRSREEFLDHVTVSWPEYNRLYAHPFEWYWSNHMMRRWFAKHAQK